jgi:hypothetical protein
LDECRWFDDWIFVCGNCLSANFAFLDEFPDGKVPPLMVELVEELRRDYNIDIRGNPEKRGIGFRVDGGRWLHKEEFWGFSGVEEFDKEFGVMDVEDEDRNLPLAQGQTEFAQVFKDLYARVFERMAVSGRRVVQNSDVQDALSEAVRKALQRARERRDEDDGDI